MNSRFHLQFAAYLSKDWSSPLTALAGAQQPDGDLRLAALAVAVVAELRQRASAPL